LLHRQVFREAGSESAVPNLARFKRDGRRAAAESKVSLAQTGSPMNRNRDRLQESTEEGAEAVNVAQS